VAPRLERTTFRSYSGLHQVTGQLTSPRTIDELRATLKWAREQGRSLSFSGSRMSFDSQYISDLVVSLRHLNSIRVSPAERTVEVGPGARWGEVMRACLVQHLIPYVVVTSEQPSAGGTLAANTNGILTSCVGKEGKQVLDFDLMLADGSVVTCSRQQNAELFYGAISGLGSLGAFTRIRYRLLDLKGPSRFEIEIRTREDLEAIESHFRTQPGEGLDDVANVWGESTLFFFDGEQPKYNIYPRRLVPREGSAPSPWVRYLASLPVAPLVHFAPGWVNGFLARDTRNKTGRQLFGLDDLHSGNFFMHGDYLFHKLGSYVGYRTRLYQHSYFIPLRGDQVTRFTQLGMGSLKRHGLEFAMFDIMFVPQDEPFSLSSSSESDGFYVNATFLDSTDQQSVMAYFQELNAECLRMGGRMNLVKNAWVDPKVLETMYRPALEKLVALKSKVDPKFAFNSNFLREKFPTYFARGQEDRLER
jgi:FAD binding domain/D-arabinono-1,4-lactone oxidase